jgi:hypothetical protein
MVWLLFKCKDSFTFYLTSSRYHALLIVSVFQIYMICNSSHVEIEPEQSQDVYIVTGPWVCDRVSKELVSYSPLCLLDPVPKNT